MLDSDRPDSDRPGFGVATSVANNPLLLLWWDATGFNVQDCQVAHSSDAVHTTLILFCCLFIQMKSNIIMTNHWMVQLKGLLKFGLVEDFVQF